MQGSLWSGTRRHQQSFYKPGNNGVRIMIKYVLSVGLVAGLALPAFAAEYFIVRGPDKQCRVVEKRPTEKTIVVVGDRAYVTKEEATKQVAVVCKER